MSKKQKIELIWLEKENRRSQEPRMRIRFAEDPQREDSPVCCHAAILEVCSDPRCHCMGIQFQCLPILNDAVAAPTESMIAFWLHLNDRSIVIPPAFEKDPVVHRLAEIVRAELTEADTQRLITWFLANKSAIIENTPPSKIDITNLPNADDRILIGFTEVFPYGWTLNFVLNNELWAVRDLYCVQPDCDCTEPALCFLRVMDAIGQKLKPIPEVPTVHYNYRSEAFRPMASGLAGSPSLDELLATLKRDHPSLSSELKRRHRILQSIYARHFMEQARSQWQSQFTNPVPVVSHKIGRNEPCPCGSGRKYKQCCLNKPS